MIDLDPQASLTFSFFTVPYWDQHLQATKTIKRWFETVGKPDQVALSDLISTPDAVKAFIPNGNGSLDLVSSHLGLVSIDLELASNIGGSTYEHSRENFMKVHRMLADELRSKPIRRNYDLVLVDCPPNLNVLNKNAIIASDWVLIPAKADHLSTLGIEYLVRHMRDLVAGYNRFKKAVNGKPPYPAIGPKLLGVVFSMVNMISGKPIRALQTFIDEVKKLPDTEVFDSVVRYNASTFATAPRDGVPVSVKSSVQPEIAQELDALADEFVKLADLTRKQP